MYLSTITHIAELNTIIKEFICGRIILRDYQFEGLAQEVPYLRGDTYPFKDSIDEGNG
jgi:hypothetical protein